MGNVPKDYDVATDAWPERVMELFPRSRKVGAAFGVVLVWQGKAQVEVATFRTDGVYSDGRHPDSVVFTNARDDARRRDFTCNGLFFDPVSEQLHDFVGGREDIEAKVLRAIGEPHQRFAEDHLRMLRAIRFAARLRFQIEERTRGAIEELQSRIELISRERIGEEIRMMLERGSRVRAMELLGSFPVLFAEVLGVKPHVGGWAVLGGVPESASRGEALMAMLMDGGMLRDKPPAEPGGTDLVRRLRTRLMLSNEETELLLWLAREMPRVEKWEELSNAALKRIMAGPHWGALEMLYGADPANVERVAAFSERVGALRAEGVAPQPLVTGDALIRLGVTPGPAFKGWLEALYDRQLEGELRTEEEAMAAARRIVGE